MRRNKQERPPDRPVTQARSKVWIERDGQVLLSQFRAGLLEAIERHGSVAAAAQALKLPYRTAWKKLREMERAAGARLVASSPGGAAGGHSRLTPAAREMLDAFSRIAQPASRVVAKRFALEAGHLPPGERDERRQGNSVGPAAGRE